MFPEQDRVSSYKKCLHSHTKVEWNLYEEKDTKINKHLNITHFILLPLSQIQTTEEYPSMEKNSIFMDESQQ